ncbi:MAG: hypothetical protein Q9159_001878 [Coniocarpon cinnabarinum]
MSLADHEPPTLPIPGDISAEEALSPLFATSVAFLILNFFFLALRFYTVLFLRSKRLKLAWDDWFLLPAWAATTGTTLIGILIYHYEGQGNPPYTGHDMIIDPKYLKPALACIWAVLLILTAAYAFTRYSILCLYLRVFTGRWIRIASYFFIAFITCQWISFTIATIVQCSPVAYYWDRTIEGGTCFNVDKFNKSFTPVNIAADALILLLPLVPIWKLQASKLRKAGYSAILGLGAFALAASIVRAVVLDSNPTTLITPHLSNIEVQWLIIEPSLYFITACLPTMHPLFRLLAPAPLRRVTETKIAQARQRGTGLHSSGTEAAQPFARLVDDDPSVQRERHRAGSKAAQFGGAPGGLPESQVQATAVGRGRGTDTVVPMQDLRNLENLENDNRIVVHTEIIISQEERIENVMGF